MREGPCVFATPGHVRRLEYGHSGGSVVVAHVVRLFSEGIFAGTRFRVDGVFFPSGHFITL